MTARAVRFEGGLARGAEHVARAAADGADWVALRVAGDLRGLRAAAAAAGSRRIGLMLFFESSAVFPDLRAELEPLAPLDPASLRDRLLAVVPGERMGRRLRGEARWAPSALDLGAALRGGLFARLIAGRFPNHARAQADADDLIVPAGRFGTSAGSALADTLRRRGARLWVLGGDPPPGGFGTIVPAR